MSEQNYQPGQIVFSQLSRSGTVEARVCRVDEAGAWFLLRFLPQEGGELVSPAVGDPFHPLALGMFPEGPGGPVLAYEGEAGQPVVLAPRPKGDLSPAVYRRLVPSSEGWQCVEEGAFLATESPQLFTWTQESQIPWEASSQCWLELSGDGAATVYRLELTAEDSGAPQVTQKTAPLGTVSGAEISLA